MIARVVVVGLAVTTLLPLGGRAYRWTEEGNAQYEEGRFEEALRSYTKAQVELPEAAELYYNIGNVLYRQNEFRSAAEAFARALLSAPDELVGRVAFNLGNASFRAMDYESAVESYEQALRADPADMDAKRNLELALRAMEQQRQQGEDQQEEEPQEPEEPPADEKNEEQDAGEEPASETPQSPEEEEADPTQTMFETEGQMTPQQAERMLDGLEEQELENLRRQALRKPRLSRQTSGEDW
jgi:Ca-activated chloride channel family protein